LPSCWEEIGSRPGDPDSDMIDIYEKEAGAEEGWGHAEYDRTLYSTAVVSAWETFHAYLVRQLFEACLRLNLREYPALAKLVVDERRSWERRFDRIKDRYKDFLDIRLTGLPNWDSVAHAQELRNALVHNLGRYTAKYLGTKLARRPTREDLHGRRLPKSDDGLIDHESIPLTKDFSDEVICRLIDAAKEIDDAIKND
jgi:hypothetical protein